MGRKKKADPHEGHDHDGLKAVFAEYTALVKNSPDVEQFKHFAMLRATGVRVIATATLRVGIYADDEVRMMTTSTLGGIVSVDEQDLTVMPTDLDIIEGVRGLLLGLQMEFNKDLTDPVAGGEHRRRSGFQEHMPAKGGPKH